MPTDDARERAAVLALKLSQLYGAACLSIEAVDLVEAAFRVERAEGMREGLRSVARRMRDIATPGSGREAYTIVADALDSAADMVL